MSDAIVHAQWRRGKLVILGETKCHELECKEYGCYYPDCAKETGEQFDTIEAAEAKYPRLVVYSKGYN